MPASAAAAATAAVGGRGRGEVDRFEQCVDEHAARRRAAPRAAAPRQLGVGQAKHALQVVAVAAALISASAV